MKKLLTNLTLKIAATESNKLVKIRRIVNMAFLFCMGLFIGVVVKPFWLAITLVLSLTIAYGCKSFFDLMIERVVTGRQAMDMMTDMLANISQNMAQGSNELGIKEVNLETQEREND